MIDTHAHAYDADLMKDYDGFVARAKTNGVSKILLPNIDLDSVQPLKALVEKDPNYFVGMMGLHPCYVKENWEADLANIKEELFQNTDQYCAVGEIGLDYHWDTTFVEEQKSAFRIQIEWALELKKPINVHTRKSLDEALDIIKSYKGKSLTGIIHCFSGSMEQAKRIIDLGFLMGIGGVVTYKNAGVAEVVKEIPMEYVVLETDSPYLAPVPYRGKTNEPSYIKYAAEKIAELKGISLDEVVNMTSENVNRIISY
jgi:TatD DNase family protein